MKELFWTKKEARDFMVKYHMINTKNQPSGQAGLKSIFDRLQSIQYDPLDVVSRNSDLVLQARLKHYNKELLQSALYSERYLMDGWDKMMSIHPSSDFPYFYHIRESRKQDSLDSFTYRNAMHAVDYAEEILDQIRNKGPLYSREIFLDNEAEQLWENGKLSSITLDYLFNTGQIVVYNKRNAQKQFEITKRVFDFKRIELTDDEFTKWYLQRRISSMGLVWNKTSVSWSGKFIYNKSARSKHLEQLLHSGVITKINVEGINESLYTLTKSLCISEELQNKISFIAPLDNLIWDRDLVANLFDFEYRWEVYTPASKRKYGYYVLPILYGSNFIGRIEFAHHRKNNPLVIKNVWFEPNEKITNQIRKALDQALEQFKQYLSASEIVKLYE